MLEVLWLHMGAARSGSWAHVTLRVKEAARERNAIELTAAVRSAHSNAKSSEETHRSRPYKALCNKRQAVAG